MSTKKRMAVARRARHRRVRKRIMGTSERPRLNVFRSNRHIHAQIIDDTRGHTLVHASSLEPEIGGQEAGNLEVATLVGRALAQRAMEKGVRRVVFDRGGYRFHGRVAAVAEGAREEGLEI